MPFVYLVELHGAQRLSQPSGSLSLLRLRRMSLRLDEQSLHWRELRDATHKPASRNDRSCSTDRGMSLRRRLTASRLAHRRGQLWTYAGAEIEPITASTRRAISSRFVSRPEPASISMPTGRLLAVSPIGMLMPGRFAQFAGYVFFARTR